MAVKNGVSVDKQGDRQIVKNRVIIFVVGMISLCSAIDAAAVTSLAEFYALCEEENKECESINCLGMCVFGNCCTTDDKHIDWCRTSCKDKDSVVGCGEKLEKCSPKSLTMT